MNGCDIPCEYWELNLGSLQEQVLSTTKAFSPDPRVLFSQHRNRIASKPLRIKLHNTKTAFVEITNSRKSTLVRLKDSGHTDEHNHIPRDKIHKNCTALTHKEITDGEETNTGHKTQRR